MKKLILSLFVCALLGSCGQEAAYTEAEYNDVLSEIDSLKEQIQALRTERESAESDDQSKVDGIYKNLEGFEVRSFKFGDFEYVYNGLYDGIEITNYLGASLNPVIPSEIEGEQVKVLGWKAFAYEDFETISIPDSVVFMEEDLFSQCPNLRSVNFPENVTNISNAMFHSCKSLESVELPSGATRIGIQAFSHCSSLQSITLPSSIETIESSAFEDVSDLVLSYKGIEYSGQESIAELCELIGGEE